MSKVLLAMPAYNEGRVIGGVITGLREEGFKDILVVDDCSLDDTYEVSINSGAKVLRHIINRGAGAASMTAIEYARREGYDFLILMDSDGQHSPKDAKKLLNVAKKSRYDLIIGSRMIGDIKDMPFLRKVANFVGSFVTYFVFGGFVFDSQSGFRVLNKKAIKKINLSFDTFEFCSEMIGEAIKNNLKIKEVSIKVRYTDHSLNKGHGQSILNGFKMLERFLFK